MEDYKPTFRIHNNMREIMENPRDYPDVNLVDHLQIWVIETLMNVKVQSTTDENVLRDINQDRKLLTENSKDSKTLLYLIEKYKASDQQTPNL